MHFVIYIRNAPEGQEESSAKFNWRFLSPLNMCVIRRCGLIITMAPIGLAPVVFILLFSAERDQHYTDHKVYFEHCVLFTATIEDILGKIEANRIFNVGYKSSIVGYDEGLCFHWAAHQFGTHQMYVSMSRWHGNLIQNAIWSVPNVKFGITPSPMRTALLRVPNIFISR